jgi:TolB-like protein/class 3 adenylate cyclase/Flp pilus assembly protein TadD
MNEERAKRKLTAILSADVKGYSRLMGEDELATIETLKKHQELISSLIYQYRGRVIDSPGDNLLAEFGSAVDAVECAMKIQEDLKKENDELPERRRMDFRIGVNLGDVVEDGERIYGDGVNIAARIEGLADGGGICISRTAYDHVKNKISTGYEYLGEHRVKNIKDPVSVYRLLPDAEAKGAVVYKRRRDDPRHRRRAAFIALVIFVVLVAAFLVWHFYFRGPRFVPASVERMAFPLPDKPSIAVLPFTNMSGDPEQDYIADGLSENIIATLSKASGMFVIARNSTFTYKGKPVKVGQVAEELGIRFVLEGSVQKSGDRLRVTAQLIDAINGRHLWSEKYDRKMRDFFDLQDEITKKIVVELRVEVETGEVSRLIAKSTDSFEAWTNVAKGMELFLKMNKEDNIKARALFETAIKLDPKYVGAWQWLARTHQFDARFGWSESRAASLQLALELALKALALDDKYPPAHAVLGGIYLDQRQFDKAISENRMAVSLDPNFSPGYAQLAGAMNSVGEFEESITLIKTAMRLSPYYEHWYLAILAQAYFLAGRYEEAIVVCNQRLDRCRKGECPIWRPLAMSAMANAKLGRVDEARKLMAEALESNPKLSLAFYRRGFPFKNPAHLHQLLDAASEAGLK